MRMLHVITSTQNAITLSQTINEHDTKLKSEGNGQVLNKSRVRCATATQHTSSAGRSAQQRDSHAAPLML